MDFFESLSSYLMNSEELQEVVDDRIYPHVLPDRPILPSIVYTPVSTKYGDGLRAQTGFVRQIVQFSVHNTTFGNARRVGRILKAVLSDFSGDMRGTHIQATHLLTDLSVNGDSMTNYNKEEYMNVLEFEFDYMEE